MAGHSGLSSGLRYGEVNSPESVTVNANTHTGSKQRRAAQSEHDRACKSGDGGRRLDEGQGHTRRDGVTLESD